MHLKRWLSGLIMAPALIWVVLYAPRPLFLAFILLLTFQGWREFQALLQAEQPFPQRTFTLILGLLLTASLYRGEGPHVLPILGMIFLLRFAFSLFPPHDFPLRLERLSRDLLGLFYISFLLGHFLLLHGLEEGPAWVLFTLAAVYSGDTAAFYVGLAWGKKKLAPRISPGKTVEGGLGAVGGSLLGALLFKAFFFSSLSFLQAFFLGIAIGISGQLGDLCESFLKRSAMVKDSGSLIPGHGGLLDRIDSVLFAGPVVYYFAWAAGYGRAAG